MRPLAFLVVLLLAPLALAQEAPPQGETLASLEEPHTGTDRVWSVTVLQEEAGRPRALVLRNPLGSSFDLEVSNAQGETVYNITGSRGVQTLPALEAGVHTFFVRRSGTFQVTEKAFERDGLMNFSGELGGSADAFVLAPTTHGYNVSFEGDVRIDWWDLTASPVEFTPPAERGAAARGAYIITVRGAEGTPYSITLESTAAPELPQNDTPAPGFAALLGVGTLAALALRRRG